MAYEAGRLAGTYPSVLNASNEVAVKEFLKGRVRFTDIPRAIEKVLNLHTSSRAPQLGDILEADKWSRARTKEILDVISG